LVERYKVAYSVRDRGWPLNNRNGGLKGDPMQKKPQTLVAKFHAMFTTHILLGIIGALLGTIALRLLGVG